MNFWLTLEGHRPGLLGLDGNKPHCTTNMGQDSTKTYPSLHLRGISEYSVPCKINE